jgi:hypothetical protein
MLGYLLAAAGVRWLGRHVSPNADAYLAAGAIGVWLVWTAHRRTRHYAIEDALNRSTDEERERLLANLQPRRAEVDPEVQSMSFEEAMTDTLVFTYPRGSRSMAVFQFWMCVLLGSLLLAPLALGRITEPADSWILFFLGGLIVMAGLGHRYRLRWLNVELMVSPERLTETIAGRVVRAFPWAAITHEKQHKWTRSVEYAAAG